MDFSQCSNILQKIITCICLFMYCFFISSFLFIYCFGFTFQYKQNDNFNLIKDYYNKYIVFSTVFDSLFLLGIFTSAFIVSYLFDIQNILLQLLVLIILTIIGTYFAFYIILPMINYNAFANSLVKQFKQQNVFCHYSIFSILIFGLLKLFKRIVK